MGALAIIPDSGSPIDARFGCGYELLLRVAIIAERGAATGIDVSELRRLIGFPGDALERMHPADLEDLVKALDPARAALVMLAKEPTLARGRGEKLREAVIRLGEELALPPVYREGV